MPPNSNIGASSAHDGLICCKVAQVLPKMPLARLEDGGPLTFRRDAKGPRSPVPLPD